MNTFDSAVSYVSSDMGQIEPRPASTVVIVRNQNEVLEILMLRRSREVSSAPGAHVFPGGVLDGADTEVVRRGLHTGFDALTANQRLDLDEGALKFYCAALRELFEEAGLLVVLGTQGQLIDFDDRQLAHWRRELLDGRLTWPDLLDRENLRLALGGLLYFGHWVTPVRRARRFDTRFFVALAPPDQVAVADDGEIVEHVWTTAAHAVSQFESGEWSMLVPTVRTLRELSGHHDVDDVLQWAAHTRVLRIEPREVERDGRTVVVLPGEPGYDHEDGDGPTAG